MKSQGSLKTNPSPSTKEEILKAATTLFARKGIKGTTTRDIAAMADVNIAALHYHWGGKDDLVTAVYQRILDETALLSAALFQDPATPFKGAIENHLGRFYDFFVENPEYPRFLTYVALEEPPFCVALSERSMTPLIRQVIVEMKKLIQAGKIRAIDPEISLFAFYGLLLIPFSDKYCQSSVLGETMPSPPIAARFKAHFIDTVLLTLGLKESL